jgi:coenzyme F420-dependent glucose-6-phosphate dehydrogenase
MLGVGTGEALNEVASARSTAAEWPDFKERFARLRESVRAHARRCGPRTG